jgi:exonuclease SbcC
LEDLINLQESLREAELRMTINKAQSGTKVSIYKNYLESLIDILYDLQKKKAEREFAIYNVNEKYKNLSEYKKQIADGKNIELVIDSKKEERVKLRDEQYRINNERAEIQKQMSLASANLDVLNEKLDSTEKQLSSAKGKIVLSGVPEGVSLDDEKLTTTKAIAELKFNHDDKETKLYSLRENLSRTEHEYDVNMSILDAKRNEIENLEAEVNASLINGNFKSNEDLEANFVDQSILKIKQNRLSDYNSRVRVLEIQKKELENEITTEVDENNLSVLKDEIDKLNEEIKVLSENVGKTNADFERIVEDNKKYNEFSKNIKEYKTKYDLAKDLMGVLKGKALAEYVAEEYLQEIAISANEKLALLMDGKYTLKFEDKEFVVEDNLNDALVRPASTLSGGETFLVSLSLALSISEAISMLSSRSMDFFFLDEGFGTLDDELCTAVVGALYKLESQNLKVGLISHVKELEESIKNRVLVEKDSKGSHIKIEHSL